MYAKAAYYGSLRSYIYVTGITISLGVFSLLSCFDYCLHIFYNLNLIVQVVDDLVK